MKLPMPGKFLDYRKVEARAGNDARSTYGLRADTGAAGYP